MPSLRSSFFLALLLLPGGLAFGRVLIYKQLSPVTLIGGDKTARHVSAGYIILEVETATEQSVLYSGAARMFEIKEAEPSTFRHVDLGGGKSLTISEGFEEKTDGEQSTPFFGLVKGINRLADLGDGTGVIAAKLTGFAKGSLVISGASRGSASGTVELTLQLPLTRAANQVHDDLAAAVQRVVEFLRGKGYTEKPAS